MEALVKVVTTIIGVAIAVGIFSTLWVGANLLFNKTTSNWKQFTTISGAVLGFLLMVVLHGNELLINPLDEQMDQGWIGRLIAFIWLPLLGVAIGAIVGNVLGAMEDSQSRLILGVSFGAVLGLVIAMMLRDGTGVITTGNGRDTVEERSYLPAFRPLALIIWTVLGAAAGAGWAKLRESDIVRTTLIFGSIGWLIGAFAASQLGNGPRIAAIIACLVPGLALGYVLGTTRIPDIVGAARINEGARPWLFVGPAVFFIFVALVAPAILTGVLSLQDRDSENFVALDNYGAVLSDADNFEATNWTDMFTSRLFIIGILLLGLGFLLALIMGRQTGQTKQFAPGSGAITVFGVALVFFALVTTVRGTIINNLWWVFGVTLISVALGLAIAVLADGARFERVAKAIIFMPMAISFVGASVVWRLIYQSKDASQTQTGVLNAAWAFIGRTTFGGAGRIVWTILLLAALAGFGVLAFRALSRSDINTAAFQTILGLIPIYLLYRMFGAGGIRGFGSLGLNADGGWRADPIQTLSQDPWNTFFLMIVLIWIQTGFAMVILSSAIKAVPGEYIEAAQIDGATDSDVFWRITLPQIAPTITVVGTTIVVLVMKVFDIVKVMTNGNFETNVLANAFYNTSFQNSNAGEGSAIAVLLFLSVLPVMVYNIRRGQVEEA